jgi:hypothetical protein
MHLPRFPRPVRDILWFTVIGALVGAAYGHMIAVAVDSHPLLGLAGLPRGILTGVLITGILFSLERGLAQPAVAWLSGTPFLVNLAIKTAVYLAIILFSLAVGARLPPGIAKRSLGDLRLRQGKQCCALCARERDRRRGRHCRVSIGSRLSAKGPPHSITGNGARGLIHGQR